jgi:hypothetical protein
MRDPADANRRRILGFFPILTWINSKSLHATIVTIFDYTRPTGPLPVPLPLQMRSCIIDENVNAVCCSS